MMRARKIIGESWAQIRIMPDTSLRFRYRVDHVCTCEFSMLCEVGEKYKPYFISLMSEHGIELGEQLEFDAAPWVADTYRMKGDQ
jgi:hypothetical protein